MYEVEIWTVLPGVEGEIHMMSQTSIKTYEEAVEAAERYNGMGFKAVVAEMEPA